MIFISILMLGTLLGLNDMRLKSRSISMDRQFFLFSWTIGPLFMFHDFPGREERTWWSIFLPIDLVITFLSLLILSIL